MVSIISVKCVYLHMCAFIPNILCFYVALFLSTGKFNVALTALDAILSFCPKIGIQLSKQYQIEAVPHQFTLCE